MNKITENSYQQLTDNLEHHISNVKLGLTNEDNNTNKNLNE